MGIEMMTRVLNEKEETIELLRDNLEKSENKMEELNNKLNKASEEEKKLLLLAEEEGNRRKELEDVIKKDEEVISTLTYNLQSAETKLSTKADTALHGDQSLMQEIRTLRQEKEDRVAGMENLHH